MASRWRSAHGFLTQTLECVGCCGNGPYIRRIVELGVFFNASDKGVLGFRNAGVVSGLIAMVLGDIPILILICWQIDGRYLTTRKCFQTNLKGLKSQHDGANTVKVPIRWWWVVFRLRIA